MSWYKTGELNEKGNPIFEWLDDRSEGTRVAQERYIEDRLKNMAPSIGRHVVLAEMPILELEEHRQPEIETS